MNALSSARKDCAKWETASVCEAMFDSKGSSVPPTPPVSEPSASAARSFCPGSNEAREAPSNDTNTVLWHEL